MMGDKIACSEQFRDGIQFTVYSWDFMRKMQGWAILAVALLCITHPVIFYKLISKWLQINSEKKKFNAFNSPCKSAVEGTGIL